MYGSGVGVRGIETISWADTDEAPGEKESKSMYGARRTYNTRE